VKGVRAIGSGALTAAGFFEKEAARTLAGFLPRTDLIFPDAFDDNFLATSRSFLQMVLLKSSAYASQCLTGNPRV
jgi:hypothetical protein